MLCCDTQCAIEAGSIAQCVSTCHRAVANALHVRSKRCRVMRNSRPKEDANIRLQRCHRSAFTAMGQISIVARPMTSSVLPMHFLRTAILVAIGLSAAGCDRISARKLEHDGSNLFREGKTEEAVVKFEASLLKEDIPQTHHNLGLAYSKLIKPGCAPDSKSADCAKNQEYSAKATEHFATYLRHDPKNNQIRAMMTQIWMENGQFDKALEFWNGILSQDPNNPEIMGKLAGINLKARRWREAMDWYGKQGQAATGSSKVVAYQSIGNVAWAILSQKDKTVGEERIECADRGIAGLEKAAELAPKKPDIQGLLAAMYNLRSIAQGPIWAAAIDKASGQTHARIRNVLAAEAKAAEAKNNVAQPKAGG